MTFNYILMKKKSLITCCCMKRYIENNGQRFFGWRKVNSKFYTALSMKKINHISSLKSDDGVVVSNHEGMCRLLKNYYTNVFVADDVGIYPRNEIEEGYLKLKMIY